MEESSLWSNRLSSHLPPPHEPRQTEWQPTRLNISTSHYEKEASLRQSPQLAFRIQSALLHTKIILLLNLGAASANQTQFYFEGVRTTHLARGNLSQGGCIVNRHRTSWCRRHTIRGIAWLVTLVCYQEALKDGKRLLIVLICSGKSHFLKAAQCSQQYHWGPSVQAHGPMEDISHLSHNMTWSSYRSRPLPPQIHQGLKAKQKWRC